MEQKLRQKEKKQSSKIAAAIAVEGAELFHSVQSEDDIAQKRIEVVKASDELKDNENNIEIKPETYIYKSEEPR